MQAAPRIPAGPGAPRDASPELESKVRWNLPGIVVMGLAHGTSDWYSGMVPLLIFTIVTAHALPPLYQGALGFLWYLTSSIVQPLFGAYADRAGRWWFLPASVALTACAIPVIGIAGAPLMLVPLIILGGFGSAVMHPEAGKYTALLSGKRKSTGISIFQIGGALGYAVGPITIAALITHFGTKGSLITLIPGVCLALAILALTYGLRSSTEKARAAHAASIPASARVDRVAVIVLMVGTALKYLVGASFMTYLPNLITSRGGSIGDAGTIVTAFLAIGVVGLYAGGRLGDRFGATGVSVASLAASAPLLVGFLVTTGPVSIALLLLGNALLNIQGAPSVAIVQRMLPRNLGMALGLMNGVAFGAGSAMVIAVGFGVGKIGASEALMWVSALAVVSAATYWIAGRRSGPVMA